MGERDNKWDNISKITDDERDPVVVDKWPEVPNSSWKIPDDVRKGSPLYIPQREFGPGEPPQGINGRTFTEYLLLLPSAPIYSIHRKRDHQVTFPRLGWHSFRLIKDNATSEVDRIYLLHNGLNEIDNFRFFYEVAWYLISKDPTAAVIINPFPRHLTRSPFPMAYAQRPLDAYLRDAGNLFRQYLRYMLESQWLISMLVPCADYYTLAGLNLIARTGSTRQEGSRHDPKVLAESIHHDWMAIREGNRGLIEDNDMGDDLDSELLTNRIEGLRKLIGWKPGRNSADTEPPSNEHKAWRPYLHAVGYSLGGFTARSVFFTWPFAVASCTTICSGGALRDVGLTAFAHHEEWKSVIHALAFELESAMIDPKNPLKFKKEIENNLAITAGIDADYFTRIAGIDADYFTYFYRIFRDVFLQESRGSYASRVSEYITRLFFIVGGNDPIVTVNAVQDASPPGGLNLLEIANLSHFPTQGASPEWHGFWLPEVCGLIRKFAAHTEPKLVNTLYENWCGNDIAWTNEVVTTDVSRSPVSHQRHRDPATGNEALTSSDFQEELNELIVDEKNKGWRDGWLFILRNDVPSALWGRNILHRRGGTLHHSDILIRKYIDGLLKRHEALTNSNKRERVRLVLPKKMEDWIVSEPSVFSPYAEDVATRLPSKSHLQKVWDDFYKEWVPTRESKKPHSLRFFDPKQPATPIGKPDVWGRLLEEGENKISTLPDLWIAISNEGMQELVAEAHEKDLNRTPFNGETAFLWWVSTLIKKFPVPKNEEEIESNKAQVDRSYELVKKDDMRIIKVSGAKFNPRFRGWKLCSPASVHMALVHSAVAYVRSETV